MTGEDILRWYFENHLSSSRHSFICDSDEIVSFQIDKLRSQADEQEATLLAQEEEVHGKQKELDRLKEEEKSLLEDIKKSEKEIERLELDLIVVHELAEEVSLKANIVSLKYRQIIHTHRGGAL